jgi:hypothetical protein
MYKIMEEQINTKNNPTIKPNVNQYNLIFTNQENLIGKIGNAKWYSNLNKMYKKILVANNYNVFVKNIRINNSLQSSYICLENLIEESTNYDIFVFNPVDFATFNTNLKKMKDGIFNFLDRIKYIIIWQEILLETLDIVGYNGIDLQRDYVLKFFGNSLLTITSNLISLNSLNKHNINKHVYFTVTGYSLINNIVPLNSSINKDIDVFIYGTLHDTYTYRNISIDNIKKLNQNKYNIYISGNIYDKELDEILSKTKIVVHVPSHQNLKHMPWPKITYLQSKKVFFIIEDNDELHQNANALDKFIMSYQKNNITDLFSKIKYYLENPENRTQVIEKNFEYIFSKSNMDLVIPNLLNNLILNKINELN